MWNEINKRAVLISDIGILFLTKMCKWEINLKKLYLLILALFLIPSITLAEIITENRWDSLNSNGWWMSRELGVVETISDSTAPDPHNVLRFTYPAGFTNDGNSPGLVGIELGSVAPTELWVQFWFKYSSNYIPQITANKIYYITNHVAQDAGAPDANNILVLTTSGSLIPRLGIAGGVATLYGNVNNGANFHISKGVWHKMVTYQHVNSNGNDGVFRMWIDDVMYFDYTGLPFRISSKFGGKDIFDGFKFDPVYGGANPSQPNLPADQYFYIDETIISTTPISGGNKSIPTMIPSPPKNLIIGQ